MFCKVFKSKTYQQIVMLRCQDKDGAPEVRFFFQPDGMGVCEFGIGANNDVDANIRLDKVFEEIKANDAHDIVFHTFAGMQSRGAN